MKSKTVAAVLAFLLGGLGVHKFYLGKTSQGILYLVITIVCSTASFATLFALFFLMFIPGILALIDFIMLLCMSDDDFNAKYNPGMSQAAQPNNVSKSQELASLFALKEKGAITDEEYEAKKKEIL